AEAPVAQGAEDRAEDEVREGVARDVAADFAAGLGELDQRLDQLVRALDGEPFPAGAHLEERAPRHFPTPVPSTHPLVEDGVQRLAKRLPADQLGQHLANTA